jgi:acid stress-induced BolA-like protein IbaG/YrbA
VDLRKKVKLALERYLRPERIELKDNDGISGYVVSPQFRRMTMIDRQALIYNALRESSARLKPEEIRRVIAVAALTPEEYIGHDLSG